ncbi:hypothetical protein Ciccas_009269 [Cichlidogyrus casuarinus]|uniref:Uncharacterized protein n=1 Tax=Cichlidogyrus casuarinus TaxID=1844966 RepID=A0ABD2PY69_9PLAT
MDTSPFGKTGFRDDTPLNSGKRFFYSAMNEYKIIICQKEDEITKLRVKLSQYEETCMEAETESDLYRERVKQLTDMVETLNARIRERDIQLNDIHDELTSLYDRQKILEKSHQDTEYLREKLNKTQEKLLNLQTSTIRLQNENEELKRKIKRFTIVREYPRNAEIIRQRVDQLTNTLKLADTTIANHRIVQSHVTLKELTHLSYSQGDNRTVSELKEVDSLSQEAFPDSSENLGLVLENEELKMTKLRLKEVDIAHQEALSTINNLNAQVEEILVTSNSTKQELLSEIAKEKLISSTRGNKLALIELRLQSLEAELEVQTKETHKVQSNMDKMILSLNNQIEGLESDLSHAREENQNLFTAKSSLIQENSLLKANVATIKSSLVNGKVEEKKLRQEMDDKISVLKENHKMKINKDESKIEDLTDQLIMEKNQNASLLAKTSEMESRLIETQGRLTKVTSNWQKAERNVQEFEFEVSNTRDLIQKLKHKNTCLTEELASRNEKLGILEEHSSALDDRLRIAIRAVKESEDLKFQLDLSKSHQQEVVGKMVRLEYENQELQQRIDMLNQQKQAQKAEQACSTRSLSSLELFDRSLFRKSSASSTELNGHYSTSSAKPAVNENVYQEWPPYSRSTNFYDDQEQFKQPLDTSHTRKRVARSILSPWDDVSDSMEWKDVPKSPKGMIVKPVLKQLSPMDKEKLLSTYKQLARSHHSCNPEPPVKAISGSQLSLPSSLPLAHQSEVIVLPSGDECHISPKKKARTSELFSRFRRGKVLKFKD